MQVIEPLLKELTTLLHAKTATYVFPTRILILQIILKKNNSIFIHLLFSGLRQGLDGSE